jgi:hypothetical protein
MAPTKVFPILIEITGRKKGESQTWDNNMFWLVARGNNGESKKAWIKTSSPELPLVPEWKLPTYLVWLFSRKVFRYQPLERLGCSLDEAKWKQL